MGLPGHRRTSGDKRRRAAQFGLKACASTSCGKCGKTVKPHRACSFCGTYKNRQVLNVEKRTTRSAKKHKGR